MVGAGRGMTILQQVEVHEIHISVSINDALLGHGPAIPRLRGGWLRYGSFRSTVAGLRTEDRGPSGLSECKLFTPSLDLVRD